MKYDREKLKIIQRHLGGLDADGVFGPATLEAVFAATVPNSRPVRSLGELDPRSKRAIATLLPEVQPVFEQLVSRAKLIAAAHGADVRAISGNRTYDEQDAIYAKGRTQPGKIVTRARGGYSRHNFGIAIDLGTFGRSGKYLDGGDESERRIALDIYRAVAKYGEAIGIKWGGDWKGFPDPPHFEFVTGYSLADLRQRVDAGLPIVDRMA